MIIIGKDKYVPFDHYDTKTDEHVTVLPMIYANGVWVWIGEYYQCDFKRQKGVVINVRV